MSAPDQMNDLFQLAVRFINETGRHLFLTGRAGTGKTTFLKYIVEATTKKSVVVAPTGVAAINAGGVTMHSFFQLPFGPYIPAQTNNWSGNQNGATDQHSLIKNLRFNSDKRQLLQELELLIIDEVSMLRADMLDAIDLILRHFRKQYLVPYGGVQVLFIGDLFQLPPVVNNDEWQILNRFYRSPFFFDAHVVRQAQPLYLELTKIYRQNDTGFIEILNRIRNNNANPSDFELLNRKYIADFRADSKDNYITLTTHNSKADLINNSELERLAGKSYWFDGEVKGDFSEKSLPVDKRIEMKVGAQIMFTKNDKGENRRYYNGKIGTITRLDTNRIFVTCVDEVKEIEVEKETWRNIRYVLDAEERSIKEEELGTFTQYPIRLAWAITIHKSQGLTFAKAVIDAGASFAAGQVYVALSRLTSLDGLVLGSRLLPGSVYTDEKVIEFTRTAQSEDALKKLLEEERNVFLGEQIEKCFGWIQAVSLVEEISSALEDWSGPDRKKLDEWIVRLREHLGNIEAVADKFKRQLRMLLNDLSDEGIIKIYQRTAAARSYFVEQITPYHQELLQLIKAFEVKFKVKLLLNLLTDLHIVLKHKSKDLQRAESIAASMLGAAHQLLVKKYEQPADVSTGPEPEPGRVKKIKGHSSKITLRMFKDGMSILQIAEARNMTAGTIESHLISFLPGGEIQLEQIVSVEKIKIIEDALIQPGVEGLGQVKQFLGDDFTYREIKAVLAARKKQTA